MTFVSRSKQTKAPATPLHGDIRCNWTRQEALALYEASFNDLLFQAQTVHRKYFDPNKVQLSRLLSIKTGGCPQDFGSSSQPTPPDSRLQASQPAEGRPALAPPPHAPPPPPPPPPPRPPF